ncbi:MAG: asparagine synthase-related protein [Candidatus Nanopelagicales bacterium]
MCGFAGVVGSATVANLDGVATALRRRGPDETGVWQGDDLALVASRLTHWEEGASKQPYVGQLGAAAVLNGELYNLPALRLATGLPGASEIEVLVAGLRSEGPAFLNRVDGQFAALVRCSADGPVYAVRDRFGICPLYYCAYEDGVAVASDLEALMHTVGGKWDFSLPGLSAILENWAPTGSLSAYEGVRQVPPGGALTIVGNEVEEQHWWSARPTQGYRSQDIADLEEALRHSVDIRLRSTGRVGCLLSGGIDSTVIAALAAEQGQHPAIGLYLDGEEVVQQRQQMVADAVGMDLVQLHLTPSEVLRVFVGYLNTRKVPLVRLGPIGMTALAQFARHQGFRAVLSGEGSDELFAGYDSYRILAARAGAFGPVDALDWSAFGVPEFGADRSPTWMRAYWRGTIGLADGHVTRRRDILTPLAGLFREPLRSAVWGAQASAADDERSLAALEVRRGEDVANLLGSYLLTVQGDHAWMEEGVEIRPPFLAEAVAQWAFRNDPRDMISVETGKLPVRRLLARLASANPALARLDFAKAAFRVDASFLLRDDDAFGGLMELVSACPDDLLDTEGVYQRAASSRTSGRCSEAESMVYLLAASLGALSGC